MPQIFDESITEAPSLEIYFSEQLREHGRELRPPPDEDTVWYLSTMLTRFGRSESLGSYVDGHTGLRPLALLYGDALEARDDRQRCLLLQQLGDMALFLGALFPHRFTKKGIQQDYVVGMGGGAYDYLADHAGKNRHIYRELSGMFARLLDVVARACSTTRVNNDEDILALYQRWLETGDPAMERQLQGLGMFAGDGAVVH
ncbi:MAG: hypothetical protein Cons2KO_13340 [Congregibacter sp.]